jgi:3-hydroxybutyryl-CoA dehydrogenase
MNQAYRLSEVAVVGVIGAGTMGAGIAQIAAAAGYTALLFDAKDGAAAQALQKLAAQLGKRVEAGKLAAEDARALLSRIRSADELSAMSGASIVIEAIVERLEVKRELFAQLEEIVSDEAILASNTSSISITALGRDLRNPRRLVGMHFFNPVPVMKLVEVISGAATDGLAADAVAQLATRWGKEAIFARSTPGFVVNRVARPFYAEALMLLQEQVATPVQIDEALRTVGFRMGPCELMDLIGHDVNYSVTESMFTANYYDRRYTPSFVQKDLVDGGQLGQKTGRGFYVYPRSASSTGERAVAQPAYEAGCAAAFGSGHSISRLVSEMTKAGWRVRHSPEELRALPGSDVIVIGDTFICITDGRTALELAEASGKRHVAVIDVVVGEKPGPICTGYASSCGDSRRAVVRNLLGTLGRAVIEVGDIPGLIVGRTIAMLVNEAADTVAQGVCDEAGVDTAMRLGTNYPAGPFEWLAQLGVGTVCALLQRLDTHYRGERYRTSRLLRQKVQEKAVEAFDD